VSNYELVYIISPAITEEAVPSVLNNVSGFVTKAGGNVTEVAQWGRKKLAYPIRKFNEGNYVLTKVEMKSSGARDLEASLKLSGEVMRHLLIKASV
jgi:small subunit ribosomal protein S6